MPHTPGPWSCGGGKYLPITALRNGKHCQIGRAETCGFHDLPSEEVEANGALMAAAPDLLAALRIAEWGRTANRCRACGRTRAEAHNMVCSVGAAIAKAEGRDA
jgi:hypothetical protein